MEFKDRSGLESQRALFDIPRDVCWMNAAYMSPTPRVALEAGVAGARRKGAPWRISASDFFTETERARALFGAILGASADAIAMAPAASYGLAIAARNLPIGRGRTVVVMAEQFPSNLYAWRRRAAEEGGRIVTAARAADGSITGPLLDAIGPETAVVACAHAHWADGAAIDLLAVSARCREVGAALVLDLAQSAGAVPIDLEAVDPDFAAAPTYKWLLGPYQTGCLYAAPRWWDGLPIEESWLNRSGSEDFAGLVDYVDGYRPGARRYDVGQAPNFALMPSLIASLELVAEWTPTRIAARLSTVGERLCAALTERGFTAPPAHARSPHFFGVGLPEHAPRDLAARLAAEGVHVSVRGDKMRIAPHVWIDDEDEARFLEAVDRLVQ